jgi:hypothetical protein
VFFVVQVSAKRCSQTRATQWSIAYVLCSGAFRDCQLKPKTVSLSCSGWCIYSFDLSVSLWLSLQTFWLDPVSERAQGLHQARDPSRCGHLANVPIQCVQIVPHPPRVARLARTTGAAIRIADGAVVGMDGHVAAIGRHPSLHRSWPDVSCEPVCAVRGTNNEQQQRWQAAAAAPKRHARRQRAASVASVAD